MTEAAANRLRIRLLSSIEEIDEVQDAWRALARTSGHPMDAPEWYSHAARCTHPSGDRLHVICAYENDRMCGVAPLILVTRPGVRRFEFIGSRTLYEPASVLAESSRAAARLASEVSALRYPVLLSRIPAAASFGVHFRTIARRRGILFNPGTSGSAVIDLESGWDAWYEQRPSRLKNVIRRGGRQLAREGKVELEFHQPDVAEVEPLLHEAFAVEQRSWKGRAGSAVLMREDLRDFFFSYASAIAERRELLVSFLRMNRRPLAMQIAQIAYGAYWQLKIGYDEAHSKQLVGLQLQQETVRWACEQGLRRYEFLGSAEPWIREWTTTVHAYHSLLWYPWNASGIGALVRDNVARVTGRLRHRARSRVQGD